MPAQHHAWMQCATKNKRAWIHRGRLKYENKSIWSRNKAWRTDYVVMPDGTLRQLTYNKNYAAVLGGSVGWKLSRFTSHVDINKDEIYEGHCEISIRFNRCCWIRDGSFVVNIKKESGEFEFYEWPSDYFMEYDYDDGFVPGALILGDIFTTPKLLEVWMVNTEEWIIAKKSESSRYSNGLLLYSVISFVFGYFVGASSWHLK